MSITGISSSILSGLSGSQNGQSKFQQIRSEFQQLTQDLQSGNLSQAQTDFTTLTQNIPGYSQAVSSQSGAQTASEVASQILGQSNGQSNTNPLLQAFSQLGQDLQSGNLQAAQQDLTNIQQTAQQNVQQYAHQAGGHRHHRHHVEASPDTSSSAASSASSASNPIDQAFSQLAQTLQSGNLQGAQQAFSALQADLQQIGGFVTAGSSGSATAATGGSLNVVA